MTISGYDCWQRKGLSRRRKLENVSTETTSSGSSLKIRGPETLKARLPTVDSRNISTTRRLELAERSARRPCKSATRSSGPRYRGAVPCSKQYIRDYCAETLVRMSDKSKQERQEAEQTVAHEKWDSWLYKCWHQAQSNVTNCHWRQPV